MANDGKAILSALKEIPLVHGQVAFWWIGQSGFFLRSAEALVLVDPYLSPNPDRLVPAPIAPEDITGLTVLACTHDHIDHLDKPSVPPLLKASPDAQIVVPKPVIGEVTALNVPADRIRGARVDHPIEFPGVTVHAIPAVHGEHTKDGYTSAPDAEGDDAFLGYIFEMAGVRVYHAGDTIPYDGLVDRLRDLRVDVGLLPINGRDYYREAKDLVGNMDEREAVQTAATAGIDLLVPMHYDMFKFNLGFPGHAIEFARTMGLNVPIIVPSIDRPFVYALPSRP